MIVESELILKLVVASLLGAAIGIEREVHKGSAGMRTHTLVCLGAALFTVASLSFDANPDRIAAGIVTGIGFLGAGVIFRAEDKMKGITTAANLWVVAAVGLAVGIGYYFAAVATTIIILIILVLGKLLEKKALEKKQFAD